MDFRRKRKRGRLLTKLAYWEHKIADPYNKGFYTRVEIFVPKPEADYPLPCILISIRNGHQKLFFRVGSVKELLSAFKIPKSARGRLETGLLKANYEADQIERDMKLMFTRRHLEGDARIVRTDTGEILAEAERIVKEAEKGGSYEVDK